MKKFTLIVLKCALILSGYVGLEKLTERCTKGFCLQKILVDDLPFRPEWETTPASPEIDKILDQPFSLIGVGSECFVFRSQEGKTVLKCFKLGYVRPVYVVKGLIRENHRDAAGTISDHPLTRLKVHEPFDTWVKRFLGIREFRIARTFSSSLIAFENLHEETGLFYLHLNPTDCFHKNITLIDGHGNRFEVDGDSTRFLLQHYATPLETHLQHLIHTHRINDAKASIDSLFSLIASRCRKGFADRDCINRNLGYIGTQAIEFDTGSFHQDPAMQLPIAYKRELFLATLDLHEWLTKHSPELLEYYEAKLSSALREPNSGQPNPEDNPKTLDFRVASGLSSGYGPFNSEVLQFRTPIEVFNERRKEPAFVALRS